ncbi:MAG: hypothetical protein ACFFAN_07745 [Promethearchaeota archaeon]
MHPLGENDVVIFQDETIVQFSPTITRMWALKGRQAEICTYGGRLRQNLVSAVEPRGGESACGVFRYVKDRTISTLFRGSSFQI